MIWISSITLTIRANISEEQESLMWSLTTAYHLRFNLTGAPDVKLCLNDTKSVYYICIILLLILYLFEAILDELTYV